jgi:hypothetical protein
LGGRGLMMIEKRHQKLARALKASDQQLDPFREQRRRNWERITNTFLPNETREYHQLETPVNLMEMALTTYRTRLVVRNPKVMVKARRQQLLAEAREFELALNMLLNEIDLKTTLRTAVDEAILSAGIVKVAMVAPEHSEMMGYRHDGGQPFADPVYLEDFLFDPAARRFESAEWIADRYRVPADMVRNSPLLDPKRKDKIKGDGQRSPSGLDTGVRTDAAAALQTGALGGDEELNEHVWLCDVYLTREQVVETYLWSDGEIQGEPLWSVEWEGPERGPYHMLVFGQTPGTPIPLPIAHTWAPMHDVVNALWRKLAIQAKRQKTILPFRGDQQDDAEKINRATDGAAVSVSARDLPKEVRLGGPDNQVIGITATMMQLFNRAAGNLDALGGLGPSSGTVGQDRIISEQANERLKDMQSRLHSFVKGIVESLGDMEYNDPVKERVITKRVGIVEVESQYGPDRREADFREFNLDIVPYSMEDRTPTERAAQLREVMAELAQYEPMLAQSGGSLRIDEYIREIGRLMDEEELMDRLVQFAEPALEQDGNAPRGGPSQNETTRRYERISRAGSPAKSVEDQMMQMAQQGGGQ